MYIWLNRTSIVHSFNPKGVTMYQDQETFMLPPIPKSDLLKSSSKHVENKYLFVKPLGLSHFTLKLLYAAPWLLFNDGFSVKKLLFFPYLEYNMRLMNCGFLLPHLLKLTKNGETNIFKGILVMKIFCLKGKMF